MNRRTHRLPVRLSVAAVAAGSLVSIIGSPVLAASSAHRAPAAAKSASSSLNAVTVAPKSSDAWAIVNTIVSSPYKNSFTVAHLHNGRWNKLAVQGRSGQVTSLRGIAAGSPRQIWAVGETVTQSGIDTPLLEKSTGGAFKIVGLKGLGTSAHLAVIASSSTTNAWAMGESDLGTSSYTLRWNGKKWTQKALTVAGLPFAAASLTTSGPKNAYAIGTAGSTEYVIHWNGKTWAISKTVTTGEGFSDIATDGSHTWAVGSASNGAGVISSIAMVRVGSTWKTIKLAHAGSTQLEGVSAVGKTAYAVGSTESRTAPSQHPVYAKLTGTKGKFGSIKKENTNSATFDIAASSKTVVAVGSWNHAACTTPTHPLAEQLVHNTWKLLSVPTKVAPATKTGQGICG